MRASVLALAFAFLLAPLAARAQDAPPPAPPAPEAPPPPPPADVPPPPPPPPPAPPPEAPPAAAPASTVSTGPVNWEALVDTYYMWNFTGDPSSQGPLLRAFDTNANSFTLNYAKVAAYMNADPVGFRIDLGYGNTGVVINDLASLPASGTGPMDLRSIALYAPAFLVQQAFATVKFDALTIDAGKFVTSVGDEVIETKANWNYSRSLLFNGQPLLHTGVRLGLKINDMLSLQASVVNGWNNDPDNNTNKTFGGQIALTPVNGASILASTYIGKELTSDTQMIFDLVAAYTVSDTFALSLNGDFFKNGDAQWWGIAGKARFVLSDMFNLAVRGEYLSTKDGGYAGPPMMGTTGVYEGTVTAAIPVRKNYEARVELRGDFSDEDFFLKGATPRGNQFTIVIGFLAWLP
jgi:hypothetical protein